MITAIAIIGTAVTLFPIVKRVNEGVSLGYVAARDFESTIIVVGIVSLLSVVTLRQDFAELPAQMRPCSSRSASRWSRSMTGHFCSACLMPGVNGVLLGYLMYTSRLVPRPLALLGLVGGLCSRFLDRTLFGLYEQCPCGGDRDTPGCCLGADAWHLAHR